jgi:hypothetical protein
LKKGQEKVFQYGGTFFAAGQKVAGREKKKTEKSPMYTNTRDSNLKTKEVLIYGNL